MACTENVPPERDDSEMEEGEIVDELDDLSDISSEEEFLLRQRLQVLENYNNVLERKKTKAKHSSSRSGHKRHDLPINDLSEISGTEFDDSAQVTHEKSVLVVRDGYNKVFGIDNDYAQVTPKQSIIVHRNAKEQKPFKPQERQIKKETEPSKCTSSNQNRKKSCRKKRSEVKAISVKLKSDSEESEDEYRNKRRKLANAVVVNRGKTDTSTLQARLNRMLYGSNKSEPARTIHQQIAIEKRTIEVKDASCSPIKCDHRNVHINSGNEDIISIESSDVKENIISDEGKNNQPKVIETIEIINIESSDIKDSNDVDEEKENKFKVIESIDLSTDDDIAVKENAIITVDDCSPVLDTVDCSTIKITENACENNKKNEEQNSDDDLELLRQHALKTKSSNNTNKPIQEKPVVTQKPQSEDEDSDTAELRLICLKSALLKKAIEMKQKQKLKKRLSQSIAQDDLSLEEKELFEIIESDNNTDIESMDMDIGSDGDEKNKDTDVIKNPDTSEQSGNVTNEHIVSDDTKSEVNKEEELDEDEDLLRAKLLTSLSKNLPNLVDPTILQAFEESPVKKKTEKIKPAVAKNIIKKPEKRIIINVGESDSEGEHEATKNLTKMHIQLSKQIDFQQKLDMFLKSARLEVEKEKLPDVVQQPSAPKTPQKFVAKAVDHLPESEQMEYKNLVKRMVELEKIKQARQVSVTMMNERRNIKETVPPRHVLTNSKTFVDNNEELISLSRKKIAEESAKMMKLKEEATKLSQKYKIVATELRNISTAITLNKKEQRSAQSRLAKIRMQHQRLLNNSSTSRHSKFNNNHAISKPSKTIQPNKIQNENVLLKKEYKNPQAQKLEEKARKTLTISVINDLSEKREALDNRLSVKVDVSSNKKTVRTGLEMDQSSNSKNSLIENTSLPERNGECKDMKDRRKDDYESPLQALGDGTWESDPNAILCPFEVGGHCKDPDCKYLHPKPPPKH